MSYSLSLFTRPALSGVFLGVLFLMGNFGNPVVAQPTDFGVQKQQATPGEQLLKNWKDCGLRKEDLNAFTSVRPSPSPKTARTATIEVDYSGFSQEARTAFQRAVDTWERHIKSDVTIRIDASFEPLEPRTLGGTRPNFVYPVDQDEDRAFEFSVVDALVDARTDEDQQPSEPDMFVSLNSDRPDWHFGDADAPSEQIDFTSTVLHEIAHGLGYLAGTGVSGQEGEYGVNFQVSDGPVPLAYTTFLAEQSTDSQVFLTNESELPNPSEALGAVLTGNQLVFDGARSNATADPGSGPVPPKIYAPSPYDPGSSISHLDEETYPPGSRDALMTPFANAAETTRLPGPIVCGQLADIGWPLGSGCQQYFPDVFALRFAETPDPANGSVTLDWQVREDTTIKEFIVEKKSFDGTFKGTDKVEAPPVTIDSLGLGTFSFRIRWTKSDGSEVTTPRVLRTTFRAQNVTSEITERDEQGRGTVAVSWDVPPGTDDFTYHVERRTGVDGEFGEAESVKRQELKLRRQTPGNYTYRISASDVNGNTVVGEETTDLNIDFQGDIYALGPYPNPVRETASFDLTARESQSVTVEVYNTIGERVYRDQREVRAQDPSFLSIDASQWASGVYFLRLRGDGSVGQTKKMIVVQ